MGSLLSYLITVACGIPGASIWSVDLDTCPESTGYLLPVLNAEERSRAAGLSQPMRRRFVVRRALLRGILSRELAGSPQNVPISATVDGKPEIEHGQLWFSTAIRERHALIAISTKTQVDVDVEMFKADFEFGELETNHFSDRERSVLGSVCDAERAEHYWQLWTRKEACVKALGLGLRLDFRTLDVLEKHVAEHQLVIEDLRVGGGLVGAVAVKKTRFYPSP